MCYEPHRDVINDASQVAIYETVLGDIHDNITHILLQGSQYLKDNRIPPAGLLTARLQRLKRKQFQQVLTGDNDFNCVSTSEGCGADTVHYQADIEGQSGPYTVEAKLLYQATQPAFVDGMHNAGDRVNRFKVMYDAVPPSVEVLDTAKQQVHNFLVCRCQVKRHEAKHPDQAVLILLTSRSISTFLAVSTVITAFISLLCNGCQFES